MQWKRADSGTWLTLNTHDLANNLTTDPVTPAAVTLPASANNTTIDLRFVGATNDNNADQAFVDDVLVVPNNAPVAVDDTYTTNEDTDLVLDAVAAGPNASPVDNDTDADGHTLTVTAVTNAAGGTVSLATGTITFTPTPNLCGTGAGGFDYTVSDGNGATDTGHVTVDITCIDDAPTAVDDTATVDEDSGANALDVLANDSDPEGDAKSIEDVTQPGNGTVVITGGGTGLTYEPDANYCNGGSPTDDFTYTLNGGSSATVEVTVTCINDAPLCLDRTITTNENTVGTTTPSCTDVDDPVSSLTYTVNQPSKGVSSYVAPNLRFDPNGQFEGLDTSESDTTNGDFTYRASDGDVFSEPAAVQVTVTGVNDAPVCEDVTLTTNEDALGTAAPDCVDPDVEPLTYSVGAAGGPGVSGTAGGNLTYDPNGQFEHLDTGESAGDAFTYKANDGTVDSNEADVAVTVTGVNDAPVCEDVSITVSENGPANSTAPDCTDVDIEPLTYTVTQPSKGVASEDDVDLTFDPDGDFEGLDTGETDTTNGDFTYQAHDGTVSSAAADVQVTVNGVNDAPVCLDRTLTTNEDTPGSVAASCTDVDVEPLTISFTQPTKGSASYVAPNLVFDPNGQYEGLDTSESDTTNGDFTYQAHDGDAFSAAADVQVTVTGVNDAPVCADVSITVSEDGPANSTAPDCTDVDIEPLTYTVTQPSKGVASEDDVDLTFDPDGEFEGLDTGETDTTNGDFTYQAHDGTVSSAAADVQVTVTGVNDAPVCLERDADHERGHARLGRR